MLFFLYTFTLVTMVFASVKLFQPILKKMTHKAKQLDSSSNLNAFPRSITSGSFGYLICKPKQFTQ